MEHEEFNSTRVGSYLWDIDVDAMEIDELHALERLCREKRNQKEAEAAYLKKLKALIEEAKNCNVQFTYSNEDVWINLSAGIENLNVEEKEYWVK